MNTNFIKFENDNIETAKGKGTISTLKFDLEIMVEPLQSDNPKAPTHRVWGKSPNGHQVECGGIWKKVSQEDKEYFTLSIRDHRFNANLGIAAFQDEVSMQAVIPWTPQEAA